MLHSKEEGIWFYENLVNFVIVKNNDLPIINENPVTGMINSCICTFNSMPLYIHAIRLLCEINTVNLHTTQTYEILN